MKIVDVSMDTLFKTGGMQIVTLDTRNDDVGPTKSEKEEEGHRK